MDSRELALDIIFDSSDEDDVPRRRPRKIRRRIPHFEEMDDVEFRRRFRLSKRTVLQVLGLIDTRLEYPTDKNYAVSPMNQLLLTLRYYATGNTQLSCADLSGVSEPTAHRIIHRVSEALASLSRQFIHFPRTRAEIMKTQVDFHTISAFPRVIGAIDCTHVKIINPGGDNAEYYRNRKGYFSLNVQVISSANLEIMDIVARWPGSTHDQTIFEQSRIRALLENGEFHNSIVLGDSGYANRAYLMTPLENPESPEEVTYNEAQIRTRNPVERTFGVWKRRFPILALGINVKLRKAMPIIVAAAVLHNIAIRGGDPVPPNDHEVQLPMPWEELMELGRIGPQPERPLTRNERNDVLRAPQRRALINEYFRFLP